MIEVRQVLREEPGLKNWLVRKTWIAAWDFRRWLDARMVAFERRFDVWEDIK